MKSVIKNKNKNHTSKNNKLHGFFCYDCQEHKLHNKKDSYRFQNRSHHYYLGRYTYYYYFNNKQFYFTL
jgi:hypothetical protein